VKRILWLPFFCLIAIPLYAQQLPASATPTKYALRFEPDLKAGKFKGRAIIDITVDHPLKALTLNAADLTFDRVPVRAGSAGTDMSLP